MSVLTMRKNKIVLSDYPYQRDISIRLLLDNLHIEDALILKEMVNHSLSIPLSELSANLNLPQATITATAAKFPSLCKIERDHVHLDKEMRRHIEGELAKFEEGFVPGIPYLQTRLSRLPPYLLPQWYALPRRCEKMFPTIVEKYFSNPKIYRYYLQDLRFQSPIPHQMVEAVFSSPTLQVDAAWLQAHLSLSSEQFQEWMLLLEFHFVCCLSYEQEEKSWKQVVTPYHEWRQYLLFQRRTEAPSICDTAAIKRTHPSDFGFVEDLTRLLEELQDGDLDLKKCHSLFPEQPITYVQTLIAKAHLMQFVDPENDQLTLLERAEEWLSLSIVDKALTMSRHPIQVEKALKRVLHSGWVYVDDFLSGFMGVLRGKEPIVLTNKGKRWSYPIPSYNEEELALIRATLCQRLFEAGIVATGSHCGKPCFSVTAFGISMLE